MTARAPAVAGSFYPADPDTLTRMVERLLASVDIPSDDTGANAYIVPHAGYRYSGRTAAQVYARLRRHGAPERIVLIGPAHRFALRGAALPTVDTWRTPLGDIAIDTDAVRRLVASGCAEQDDRPHEPEHSLEVQLPFLQRVAPQARLLPVCIGQSEVDRTVELLHAAVDGGALVLCSTDLSHYLTREQAIERDARTVEAITRFAPERIGPRDACGVFALRGLLGWARGQRLDARVLDVRTSADTPAGQGRADRVVGYPAIALRRVNRVESDESIDDRS